MKPGSRITGVAALAGMLLLHAPAMSADLRLQPVGDGIYAIIGELDQRSPTNLGNNATFGAIVTTAGVVLIDSGGSQPGAAALETALRGVTDKPVVLVINTGGQDHRWLGNAHFKAKDAEVIASSAAVADQKQRVAMQLQGIRELVGASAADATKPVHADRVFDTALDLEIGGVTLALRHAGPAHTPGDSFVWLPQHRIVFSGDIVYAERMLGVGPQSHAGRWIAAFEAMAALRPAIVVPGHGPPVSLAQATAQTYDYLVFLRRAIGGLIERGGDLQQAALIDQAPFMGLRVADQIARRNAMQVFQEMEFE